MTRPTAIEALAATRHTNDFFVTPTPEEGRKWAAMRCAVNRAATEFPPFDPQAFDSVGPFALAELERLNERAEREQVNIRG